MRHNLRQRITAGLLALLAQAGVIALFTQSRVQQVAHEADSIRLIFIQPMQVPEAAPPPPDKTRVASKAVSPALIANSDRVEPIEPPGTTRAITVPPVATPHIDWYQAMESAARSAVEREEELAQRGNPLDSKPRVLELPADGGDEAAVISMRRDNGDLVTQQRITRDKSVVCIHEHIPLVDHFDVTARFRPAKCSVKDTGPGHKPLFEDMKKPGYLTKPLPVPKSPQTRDEPPATNLSNK